MQKLKFKVELLAAEGTAKACYFYVPYSLPEVWGIKKGVKVKANVDKLFHHGYLMPDGKGNHCFGLKGSLMDELGKKAGDVVDVTLEIDNEERTVEVPDDMKKILSKNPKLKKYFDGMSFSHKKEYVEWITSAKKSETRERRLLKFYETIKQRVNN